MGQKAVEALIAQNPDAGSKEIAAAYLAPDPHPLARARAAVEAEDSAARQRANMTPGGEGLSFLPTAGGAPRMAMTPALASVPPVAPLSPAAKAQIQASQAGPAAMTPGAEGFRGLPPGIGTHGMMAVAGAAQPLPGPEWFAQRDASRGASFAEPPPQQAPVARPQFAGGGGGSGVIPAGETPRIDPARIAQIEEAEKAGVSAQQDLMRAQAGQGEVASQWADKMGQEQARQADAIRQRAIARDAEIQSRIQKMQDASDEAAKGEIDPDRYWKNMSTGATLTFAIGNFFNGFARGLGVNAHSNWDMAQKAIDNDIAAQREAIERKKGKVTDQQGILAEMYRRFGNMDDAEQAARVLGFQSMEAEMKSQMEASNSPIIQANGAAALAQLQEKTAKEMANLYEYHPAQAYGGGGGGPTEKQVRELAIKIGGENKGMSPDEARQQAEAYYGLAGGERGYAGGAAGGARSKEQAELGVRLDRDLAEIQDVLGRGTMYANSPEGRARLQSARTTASLSLPSFFSGNNRLNETELHAAQQLVGHPTAGINHDFTGTNRATAAALRTQIRSIQQRGGGEVGAPAAATPGATRPSWMGPDDSDEGP